MSWILGSIRREGLQLQPQLRPQSAQVRHPTAAQRDSATAEGSEVQELSLNIADKRRELDHMKASLDSTPAGLKELRDPTPEESEVQELSLNIVNKRRDLDYMKVSLDSTPAGLKEHRDPIPEESEVQPRPANANSRNPPGCSSCRVAFFF